MRRLTVKDDLPMLPIPPRPLGLELLPPELIQHRQWLCWRYVVRSDDRLTKVPVQPVSRRNASVTQPATWSDVEAAFATAAAYDLGVGFVLTAADPIAGIDLDDCREPESGLIAGWALELLAELETYAELSPSGSGIHVIGLGVVGAGRRIRQDERRLELYDRDRFLTVTGQPLKDVPLVLADTQTLIDALIAAAPPPPEVDPVALDRVRFPAIRSDDEVLRRALEARNGDAFARLFHEGDLTRFDDDDSRADLSLCRRLAYWTNGDADQIDRLFRRSALYREKWERADYRARTIQRAIAAVAGDLDHRYAGTAHDAQPASSRAPRRKPRQPRPPRDHSTGRARRRATSDQR